MVPKTVLKSFSYNELVELDPKSDEFKRKGKEIVEEFKTVGFLRLVDLAEFDDQEFLNQLKWFHSQSFDQKMKIALNRFKSDNTNLYRGYMPLLGSSSTFIQTRTVL